MNNKLARISKKREKREGVRGFFDAFSLDSMLGALGGENSKTAKGVRFSDQVSSEADEKASKRVASDFIEEGSSDYSSSESEDSDIEVVRTAAIIYIYISFSDLFYCH